MKMMAKALAVTGTLVAISLMVAQEAAAWCGYDYVCNAWGYCVYRWVCY